MIRSLKTLARSVAKYNLRIVARLPDDGAFRVWHLARRNSGNRGGWLRNVRFAVLSPAQDCEAHRLGLLRR